MQGVFISFLSAADIFLLYDVHFIPAVTSVHAFGSWLFPIAVLVPAHFHI